MTLALCDPRTLNTNGFAFCKTLGTLAYRRRLLALGSPSSSSLFPSGLCVLTERMSRREPSLTREPELCRPEAAPPLLEL